MRYDSDYVQNFMRQVQGFPEQVVMARSAIIEKFQRYDYALWVPNEKCLNGRSDKPICHWQIG
jgi:hypothetical protein